MTLAQLASHFFEWLEREAAAHRVAPATVTYYRRQLRPLLAVAGDHQVANLRAFDLEMSKTGWHSVQAAQRLLNWSIRVGLATANPYLAVAKPAGGCRKTILREAEDRQLRRRAIPQLRAVLLGLRLTLARPQEIRALRWCDLTDGPPSFFALTHFKAIDRRRDGVRVRVLPIVPRMARLLGRLARRPHQPTDYVFLNTEGRPWTGNALGLAVRRLRRRIELPDDLVAYTWRHTGATRACVAGVRDRMLAELLGYPTTRTTARYQHPDVGALLGALERAQRRTRRSV